MEAIQKAIKTLPHAPGVYLFRSKEGTILYVGKARDLKRRVSQYAQRDDAIGPKTALLVSQIATVETIETQSEFDAILLEADRIRTYQPKYNAIAKDDKSPLYVTFTVSEELPRILCLRKTSVVHKRGVRIYGPFQSGRTVRNLLRQLRSIAPYCTQKKRDGTPCFYTHLGLCNPCPSVIARMEPGTSRKRLVSAYRKNIYRLDGIFSGKSLNVLRGLEKEMNALAKKQRFEQAQETKLYVDRLKMLLAHHYDPNLYLADEGFLEDANRQELTALADSISPYIAGLTNLNRIECIDISNTFGAYATGSLVVLEQGRPSKRWYRRFKIRTLDAPNDFAMVAEVVRRRLAHTEWPYPNLLVIDGGKGQVSAAKNVLEQNKLTIPLIGLAKRFEEIVLPVTAGWKTIRLPRANRGLHVLERIRDESHRFALSYHRLLRKKGFL